MRDSPYPARFYGRQVDEPFLSATLAPLHAASQPAALLNQPPLARIFLLLMTVYLCCALFLIFTVSTHAAPLTSATTPLHNGAGCVEAATIAAR